MVGRRLADHLLGSPEYPNCPGRAGGSSAPDTSRFASWSLAQRVTVPRSGPCRRALSSRLSTTGRSRSRSPTTVAQAKPGRRSGPPGVRSPRRPRRRWRPCPGPAVRGAAGLAGHRRGPGLSRSSANRINRSVSAAAARTAAARLARSRLGRAASSSSARSIVNGVGGSWPASASKARCWANACRRRPSKCLPSPWRHATPARATGPGEWDTRAGTLEVAIPRLRTGTYCPDWLLERPRRTERTLTTVVAPTTCSGSRPGGWRSWSRPWASPGCRSRRFRGWPRSWTSRSTPNSEPRRSTFSSRVVGSFPCPR